MRRKKDSVCRLCGIRSSLVKSHVIPAALHKDAQKSAGTSDFMKIYTDQLPYEPTSKTGIWDRIVCLECEQRFQQWDDYGVDFVRRYRSGQGDKRLGTPDHPLGFEVSNVDYTRLKLFVLGMLWRAHVSSQPMYHRISLRSETYTALTSAVLSGNPGSPSDFSITITLFNNSIERLFMADPHPQDFMGVEHIRFYVYGGFTFFIKLGDAPTLAETNDLHLQPSKPLKIIMKPLSPTERKLAQRLLS